MDRQALSRLAARQKGAVVEFAQDILLAVESGGAILGGRVPYDDDGFDRIVTAPGRTDRSLLIQPKGALTLQRGRSFEFRVPLWKLPSDPSNYFAALFPMKDTAPWVADDFWFVPGRALLAGSSRSKARVIRVPRVPDPSNRWERFRIPRAHLARAYARALRLKAPPARARARSTLSETAQAFVIETALKLHLTMGTAGALQTWDPFVDRQGLDASVNFSGSPVFLGLQPKGAFGPGPDGLIQVHVARSTFQPAPFAFLVILEFNPSTLTLGEFAWFIPTLAIAKRVARSRDTLVFKVSPNPKSTKDNFLPWRYPTAQLPGVVATALAALADDPHLRRVPCRPHEVASAGRSILGPRFSKVADDPPRLAQLLHQAVLASKGRSGHRRRPRAFK